MTTKHWMILVLAVVALGAGAAAYLRDKPAVADAASGATGNVHAVARGALDVTLTENGTLVAKDSQKIAPKVQRMCKIQSIVEEGKVVAQDEEICKFDSAELQQTIEQLNLDIVKSEADVSSAKTEVEIQQSDNEANIKKSELAADKSKKELEKYLEGDFKKQSRTHEISIKDAENEFQKARKIYEDSQRLFEEEFIQQSELEQDEIRFDKANVQLEGARLDLEIYNRFDHPMALSDKQIAVEDADRALETARKRSVTQLRQKEIMVEQHSQRLERLKKQLEQRQEDLANMTIKAPCPGIIIYGDPQYGWEPDNIRVGGEVWGGQTIMTIPDLRVMQVKLQVHEADISKIKEGLTAIVTMDSYPGLKLTGKVSKIAALAAETRGVTEVRKFDVDITLDQPGELELRPGISARAEIQIDKKQDVLSIPLQCVFIEGGEQFCYVQPNGGGPEKRKIETGLSNDTAVEVLNGLAEGERILLYNPNLPTTGKPEEKPGDEPIEEEVETPAAPSAPQMPPTAPPGPTG